jgi:hypothetical protein
MALAEPSVADGSLAVGGGSGGAGPVGRRNGVVGLLYHTCELPAGAVPRSATDVASLIEELRSGDPELQAKCCTHLSRLDLAGSDAREALTAVLAATRQQPGHALLATEAGWVCAKLAVDSAELRALLISSGVIQQAFAAMSAHPSDAGMHAAGFALLGLLAADEPVRKQCGAAVTAAVTALGVFVEDAEAPMYICNALSAMAQHNEANRAKAVAAGVYAAAVAVLRTHASGQLQSAACRLIANITSAVEHRAAALDAGALAAVLSSMTLHPGDAEVQTAGCACFSEILDGAEDCRVTSALADAAAAVLAALRAHPDEELQCKAYFALNTIACCKGGGHLLAAGDGIEQAVATLRAPGSMRLHKNAGNALAAMCHGVPAHQVRGVASGGVFEAVVHLMRANPTEEKAQIAGCAVVLSLNSTLNARHQIMAAVAGAVEALVEALRGAAGVELQMSACSALNALAAHNKGVQRRARTAGALEAITAALLGDATPGKEEDKPAYQHQRIRAGCLALAAIAAGEEDWAVRAGAIEVLQKHTDRASPQPHCASLLDQLLPAGQRHNASRCTHAGCRRCATMRKDGLMCALEGCGISRRESGKRLQRCVACRAARYCSAAHYHEDWQRHRLECAAMRASRGDASDDD